MRRRHALSSRFQRGTREVELWGGTQPVFGGTERMDCFVARLGLRAQGQCPLTTYPRALAHLIAPEISVLAAPAGRTSDLNGENGLFRRQTRAPSARAMSTNDLSPRTGSPYRARDFRARGASWPDFDQRPPGRACTDALDPKNPHSTLSHSGVTRWSP